MAEKRPIFRNLYGENKYMQLPVIKTGSSILIGHISSEGFSLLQTDAKLLGNLGTCISHLREGRGRVSTDEVHHNEMEDRVGEEEVSKRPFRGDGQEIPFVLWVDLDAKTNCKTKQRKRVQLRFP